MKRFTAFLLMTAIILLSCMPAAFAEKIRYSSSDLRTAFQQFEECAFSAEYGGEGRDYTVRWQKPIAVYFSGDYTNDDLAFFFRFATELTENVPGMPEIRLTTLKDESNVQIYFTKLNKMGDFLSSYTEGNWGYFTFWHSGNSITRAEIAVATDVTNQKQRYHLIMEEFVGALGLANDHYLNRKSILYGEWTEVQSLTDADWLMLQFLYDERLEAGQTWHALKPKLEKLY